MGKKNNSSSNGNKANVNSGTNSKSNPSVNPSEIPEKVPDEFKKVMTDFINDFTTTFPEYSDKLKDNFVVVSVKTDGTVVAEEMLDEGRVQTLYEYSKTVYPVRFFDILYKNADIFKKESGDSGAGAGVNVNFLPDINFREVWNTPDISNNTRDTIWKYLQLILFSIITNISDRDSFGDTAKLFEAINEDELKNKLEETIKNMQDLFMNGADAGDGAGENTGEAGASGENTKFGDGIDMKEFEKFAEQFKNFSPDGMGGIDMSKFPGFSGFPGFNSNNNNEEGGADKGDADNNKKPEMPNPETIHEHISKLLNGKIGALAKEIAEETAKDFDFGIDMENAENINMSNVFQKLFKNPGKLMNMVKNVGAKLDDKFKKGDIKESELMKEASDLLSNMKNMPGMGDLSSMLSKMGMSGLGGLAGLGGKGGKVNMGALQSHLQQNMKNAKMKERMQTKLQQKQHQQPQQPSQQKSPAVTPLTTGHAANNIVRPTTSVYTASSGDQIQQTPRTAKPTNVCEPGANVVVGTNATTSESTETGYEQSSDQQKKKKKKNKNKK
jgi:hypothetical protein